MSQQDRTGHQPAAAAAKGLLRRRVTVWIPEFTGAGDNHPGSKKTEIRLPLKPQGRDFVPSFRQ